MENTGEILIVCKSLPFPVSPNIGLHCAPAEEYFDKIESICSMHLLIILKSEYYDHDDDDYDNDWTDYQLTMMMIKMAWLTPSGRCLYHNAAYDYDGYGGVAMMMPMVMVKLAMAWLTASVGTTNPFC